jgi:hypothetical protein
MENRNGVLDKNEMVEIIIGEFERRLEGETDVDVIETLRSERDQARRECDLLKKENDDLRKRTNEIEKSLTYWQALVQNAVEVVNRAQDGVHQLELIAGGINEEAK